jgi:hypothetical protein
LLEDAMHPFRWLMILGLMFSLLYVPPGVGIQTAVAKGKKSGGKKGGKKKGGGKAKKGKSKGKSRKGKSRPRKSAGKSRGKPRKAAGKSKSRSRRPAARNRSRPRRPAVRNTNLNRTAINRNLNRTRRPLRPINRAVNRSARTAIAANVAARSYARSWFPNWVRQDPVRRHLTVNPTTGYLAINRSPGIAVVTPSGSPGQVVIKPSDPFPSVSAATTLSTLLTDLDVEKYWPAGKVVDWRTGKPTAATAAPTYPTNAAAFVFAAAARLRVPLVEPTPDYLIPNRLIGWLEGNGPASGWQQVSALEGQMLANQGWMVIAAWKSAGNGLPSNSPFALGQVAVVRPDARPSGEIPDRGPRIAVAAAQNVDDTTVKAAFPAVAWDKHQITYWAHRPGDAR